MVRVLKKINRYIPAASIVFAVLAAIAGIVHLVSINNAAFADFFNFRISSVFRQALALLTGWIPFSLAEFCLFGAPCIIAAVFMICVRKSARGTRYFIRCIAGLLSVLLLLYALFVFVFAVGYRGYTLSHKMELDTANIELKPLILFLDFISSASCFLATATTLSRVEYT